MIGLVFLGFEYLCRGYKKIKDDAADLKCKKQSSFKNVWNYPMYLDHNGLWRDKFTNARISVGHLKINGEWHTCLYLSDSHRIIKDCTLEQRYRHRQINKELALKHHASVFRISEGDYATDKIRGVRYQDFKTGDIYVKRLFNGCHACYLRINDGQIIRPIDGSSEKHLASSLLHINQLQKERYRKGRLNYYNQFVMD